MGYNNFASAKVAKNGEPPLFRTAILSGEIPITDTQ
jgi:hypothetical protein